LTCPGNWRDYRCAYSADGRVGCRFDQTHNDRPNWRQGANENTRRNGLHRALERPMIQWTLSLCSTMQLRSAVVLSSGTRWRIRNRTQKTQDRTKRCEMNGTQRFEADQGSSPAASSSHKIRVPWREGVRDSLTSVTKRAPGVFLCRA